MPSLKFYRLGALPTTGEVGNIYFIPGEQNKLYICTGEDFEEYTPIKITNDAIDALFSDPVGNVDDVRWYTELVDQIGDVEAALNTINNTLNTI